MDGLGQVDTFVGNESGNNFRKAGGREVSVRIEAVNDGAAWLLEYCDSRCRDARGRLVLPLRVGASRGTRGVRRFGFNPLGGAGDLSPAIRSEEHTSELQSR